jgi:hypothetical protein
MKKLLIIAAVFAAFVGIAPAQANEQGAVAIIDVNFESHLVDGQVTEVCITTVTACSMTVVPKTAAQFKVFNHGTIMADIVRANNPSAPLFLLESGTTKTGVVTGIQLLNALNWVQANAAQHNIRSVSFSYNAGNGARCLPASPGVKVDVTHNGIVAAIANLKAGGVNFYAASGNNTKPELDYPACISDAIAVGSTVYRANMQLSDIVISGWNYTSSRLKSNAKSLQDSSFIGLVGANNLIVGNTTSVTTAIAAATNR